jgi:hypothetical protein
MKNYILLILFVMCSFTSGCLNFISNNSGNSVTSLDATAQIKAEMIFDKYYTKCGNYYYTHLTDSYYGKEYVQLSEVTTIVNSDLDFTGADIKNGLEWYGNVTFSWAGIRTMREKKMSLPNGKILIQVSFPI